MSGSKKTQSKYHIIYIPGVGDFYGPARKLFLRTWISRHRTVECVDVDWEGEPQLAPKIKRIESAIAAAEKRGDEIVVIGESAGAVLALLVYARQLHLRHIVTLCGIANAGVPTGPHMLKRASALPRAIDALKKAQLPRKSGVLHSYRARYDPIIAKEFSIAKTAEEHVVPCFGHMPTIAFCLSVYWRVILRRVLK